MPLLSASVFQALPRLYQVLCMWVIYPGTLGARHLWGIFYLLPPNKVKTRIHYPVVLQIRGAGPPSCVFPSRSQQVEIQVSAKVGVFSEVVVVDRSHFFVTVGLRCTFSCRLLAGDCPQLLGAVPSFWPCDLFHRCYHNICTFHNMGESECLSSGRARFL